MIVKLPITDENKGKRLDVFLSEALGMSRSAAAMLNVVDGSGKPLAKNYKLHLGDELSVDPINGKITNHTTGEDYECTKLPENLIEMLKDGGLVPHVKKVNGL